MRLPSVGGASSLISTCDRLCCVLLVTSRHLEHWLLLSSHPFAMSKHLVMSWALGVICASLPLSAAAGDSESEGDITIESVDGGERDSKTLKEIDMTGEPESEEKSSSFQVDSVGTSVPSSGDREDDRKDETSHEEMLKQVRQSLLSDENRQAIADLVEAHPEFANADPQQLSAEGPEHSQGLALLLQATASSEGRLSWNSAPSQLSESNRDRQLERALNMTRELEKTSHFELDQIAGQLIGGLAEEDRSAANLLHQYRSEGGKIGIEGFEQLVGALHKRGLKGQIGDLRAMCQSMTGGAEICQAFQSSFYGEDGLPNELPSGWRDKISESTDSSEGALPSEEVMKRFKEKLRRSDF